MVHSVDTPALVQKLDEAAEAARRRLDLLVQVDLAGEATKHGAAEDELTAIFDAARAARSLPVRRPDDAAARGRAIRTPPGPTSGASASCATGCWREAWTPPCCSELSMGMSHDFEVAIEEGATLVRVGTAIFGGRNYV